ncbi:MAG: hypothetical protein ACLP01_25570 [Solirubrobacteraceae bacterium]
MTKVTGQSDGLEAVDAASRQARRLVRRAVREARSLRSGARGQRLSLTLDKIGLTLNLFLSVSVSVYLGAAASAVRVALASDFVGQPDYRRSVTARSFAGSSVAL